MCQPGVLPCGAPDQMKNILAILGAFLVLVLLVAIGGLGYVAYVGPKRDVASKAYVDENVPIIVSSWSENELLARASPQLQRTLNDRPEFTRKLFSKFATLGKLKTYRGSHGDSNESLTTWNGLLITARYEADAQFEHGTANIAVDLVEIGSEWKISGFHLNSPLFLK